MADHTLGTIRGTIEIDYDGAGIVKAIKDTDQLKKSGDKLGSASSKVLSSLGSFAKGAAILGAGLSTVNSAAGLVVGTLSILGPLAGATFAAAPAVIGGYVAIMGVARIATAGVGDALSAAAGDAKEFQEATKNLSPEARKFATAWRESLPVLQGVQDAMQDAFFKGTAGQVGGVVKAVASLKPEATAVSTSLGDIAQNIVKTGTSGKSIGFLRQILAGVNDFLQRIKGSLGPVVQGFLGIAAQGAAFGDVLGGKVNGALARLSSWLSSIDVAEIFAEAGPIIRSLGSFFSDLGVIVKEVFGIFTGDGQNAAGILAELASQLAAFLQSAQGQEALQALQVAMSTIGGAAGQVFLTLLQALGPVIVALAPGAGQLATQIAGVLVPAIQALNPLLVSLAQFLSDNMSWLGPLAGVVGAVAAAYRGYLAAAAAVTAVKAAMNGALAVNTAAWLRNTAAMVASRAAGLAVAAIMAGQMVASWVASTAAIVANRIAMVASTVAMGIARAATIAWTVASYALGVALRFMTGPIGIIITIVAALAAGIIYLWNNNEAFRNAVIAIWNGIKAAISAVGQWITGTLWPGIVAAWNGIVSGARSLWNSIVQIWNGIRETISTAIQAAKAILSAVWSAIVNEIRSKLNTAKAVVKAGFAIVRSVISTVMNGIRAVVRTVWAGIVTVVRTAINTVKSVIRGIQVVITVIRNAFNKARDAVRTALTSAVSLVRGLPGRVTSALGNLGSLLREKGRSLVSGFISGIRSMIGKVGDAARSVVSAVTDFLPGSPAKKGPLSGKGYALYRAQRMVDDLAKGIATKRAEPAKAIESVADSIARSIGNGDGRMGNFPRPGQPAATPGFIDRIFDRLNPVSPNRPSGGGVGGGAGTHTVQVNIGQKKFATFTLDVLEDNPVAVAKAANEGNRKSGWSGGGRLAAKPVPQKIKIPRKL